MKTLSQKGYRSLQTEPTQFIAITGVLLLAAVLLFAFDPASSGIFPPSPFRVLTGLYCPGCGTLRGLHQLLHGHWWAAINLNPLMVACLPVLAYAYLSYSVRVLLGRSLPTLFIRARWIWLLLKLILLYWVLRNIPLPPFNWLAP